MKKYEKPAIEEFNIGATMPLMTSGPISGDITENDETGYGTGTDNDEHFASGRKDKDYGFGDGW